MEYHESNILKVIVSSQYLDQECINVFHYRVDTVNEEDTPDDDDVVHSIFSAIYEEIMDVQSFLVTYNYIKVVNLSVADKPFHIASLPLFQGQTTGDAYPSTVAYGFKLNVGTSKTKAGGKRFVGVPESIGAGNDVVSAQHPNLNQIAVVLGSVLQIDTVLVTAFLELTPIVLKKYTTSIPLASDWQRIVSASPKYTLTSQVSRKPS